MNLPPNDDPLDWGVEEVVRALCNPDARWTTSNAPPPLPPLQEFERRLRENDIDGNTLLRGVTDDSLRLDLNISSLGQRHTIRNAITTLRKQSKKLQSELPGYNGYNSGAAMHSPFAAPGLMGINYFSTPVPAPTPTSRNLEYAESPNMFHSQRGRSGGAWSQSAVSPTYPASDIYEENSSLLGKNDDRPMESQADEVSLVPVASSNQEHDTYLHENPYDEPLDDSYPVFDVLAGKAVSKAHHSQTSAIKAPDPPTKVNDFGNLRRRREVMVTDSSGRKRRKLTLGHKDMVAATEVISASYVESGTIPNVENPTETQHEADVTTDIPVPLDSAFVGGPLKDQVVDTLINRILKGQESNQNTQGVAQDITDLPESKRRRVRPVLVESTGVPDDASEVNGQGAWVTPPIVVASSAIKKRPTELDKGYLGRHRIPVDDLFYGTADLGEELRHDSWDLGLDGEGAGDDGDNFWFVSTDMISSGRRKYVHSLIKGFFLNSRLITFERDGQVFTGIKPYSDRLGNKFQERSFMLFANTDSKGVKATKEDMKDWPEFTSALDVSAKGDSQVVQEQSEKEQDPFKVTGSDPVNRDLDLLGQKWAALDDGKILPAQFGDSGSEGEYDTDTWNEIEREQKRPLERLEGLSKRPLLKPQEVNAAIDAGIMELIEKWECRVRPKAMSNAWSIRRRCRGQKKRQAGIVRAKERINYLVDSRLEKMRKEILDEPWTAPNQVRHQCKIMEETIFEIQDQKLKLSIIENPMEPAKPPRRTAKKVNSIPQNMNVVKEKDVSDAEASLDGNDIEADELAGFIVSDEGGVNGYGDDEDDSVDELGYDGVHSSRSPVIPSTPPDDPIPSQLLQQHTVDDDEMEDILQSNENSGCPLPAAYPHNFYGRKSQPETHRQVVDLTISSDIEPQSVNLASPAEEAIVIGSDNTNSDKENPFLDPSKRAPATKKAVTMRKLASQPVPVKARNPKTPSKREPGTPPQKPNRSRKRDTQYVISGSESDVIEHSLDFVRKKNFVFYESREDRDGLLIKLISTMDTNLRDGFLVPYARQVDRDSFKEIVIAGLEGIRDNTFHHQGFDDDTFLQHKKIARAYLCWWECKKRHYEDPYDRKTVEEAMVDRQGLKDFYRVVKRAIRPYMVKAEDTTPSKQLGRNVVSSTRKGRVRPVLESIEALNQRENDKRWAENIQRRKELNAQFSSPNGPVDPARIPVNIAKSDDQKFIYINPKIGQLIKKHQIDGVQFMWGTLVMHNAAKGCLLAHTMGLGKTMQVITLLVTIAEASKSPDHAISSQIPAHLQESRTLIMCPPALVNNWLDEFILWASADDGRRSFRENVGSVQKLDSSMSLPHRMSTIKNWQSEGGVLIISYDMFRNLVHNSSTKVRRAPLDEEEHRHVKHALTKTPSIVIADEAHKLKNPAAALTSATRDFESSSRIALTGSPLANNLEEYYWMIDWIAPEYLGKPNEFRAKYVEPIQDGLYADSEAWQRNKSLKMLRILGADLAPRIHRADITALKADLMPKTEFVIKVGLTGFQSLLYGRYIQYARNRISRDEMSVSKLWSLLAILGLLLAHPLCFKRRLLKYDEAQRTNSGKSSKPDTPSESGDEMDEPAAPEDISLTQLGAPATFIQQQLQILDSFEGDLNLTSLSSRMAIFQKIVRYSVKAKDKVLVFSHSIFTLDYIEHQLKSKNRKYSRLDGKTKMDDRQQHTREFNTGNTEVYLVSTKAGGLGLNLFGANRVVIFDFGYNPAWEEQAVGRAYRLGQMKPVYVYRFRAGGTFEDHMHNQVVFKVQLAARVVDKKDVKRYSTKKVTELFEEPAPVKQDDLSTFTGKDELVLDKILEKQRKHNLIRSIELTETFKTDDQETLTAEDELEVQRELELVRLRRTDPKAWLLKKAEYERREVELEGLRRTDHKAWLLKKAEYERREVELEGRNVDPFRQNSIQSIELTENFKTNDQETFTAEEKLEVQRELELVRLRRTDPKAWLLKKAEYERQFRPAGLALEEDVHT